MKRILFLAIIVIFSNCSNPKVIFNNYYDSENEKDQFYFKDFKAEEKKYSLLIFGMGYYKGNLSVSNCDSIIYTDTIKNAKYLRIGVYRIKNLCKTKIADLDSNNFIEIDTKLSSKYKFIYIEKDFNDKTKITYTNNHIPIL